MQMLRIYYRRAMPTELVKGPNTRKKRSDQVGALFFS